MRKYKILIFALIFIILFSIGTTTVHADTGPKPSIQITFENLKDEYYVTLLSKNKTTGPYSVIEDENVNLDELYQFEISGMSEEQYRKFLKYKDIDGYSFLLVTWKITPESNTFKWGYYPPGNFKILLYSPQADQFVCSEKMERYAFDSYYKVDMENFDITSDTTMLPNAVNNYDYLGEILALMVRIIITIAVELCIALLFVFGKKRLFVSIGIVNVITQIILNVILNIIHYNSGILSYIFAYIGLELLVIVLEAIAYSIIFKKSKEEIKLPILKGVAYSIVANISSFGVGLLLVNYLPFAF